ncbi:putative porin [Pseudoalteromonas sp. SG43-7]|jgi:predicted porin|uniref:Porin n=1 Tax=Pseudoalteromonas neustonica TaxID=1840331 RepID=A0ABY3F7T2_9GAMM|nr:MULTISPECIES: putative porin [Pseudoalteromonas]MBB1294996.1 putative porin [Pseudoalteromonas sp. SR41-4]MBB1302962.1 putative porin [Pseudoalteromonas sp. SR44-8]MBB1335512.1 putative porin [Pseudoalteromonas sp. SR41-6]MBB1399383.1 putative porin [Pseudoalteromonas sp. SG44-8]MBB1411184.1 putative porin [Pseudoalteromonas sp. SG44-17]|tara:strand:+ start:4638 stop:5432 length:795 start_codon:yes stop_codon:yes gene_type:complete
MKKLAVIISSILLSSAATAADNYQSISHLGYMDTDGNDTVSVDSKYYFSPKATLGPYDQFEYINKQTNVYGSYIDNDFSDVTTIGGEYFVENFVVGAQYSNLDVDSVSSKDVFNVSAGYFFNPNLLLKATFIDVEDGENSVIFDLAYDHKLNSTDYIGFTVTSDDEFDYRAVNAKYFMDLKQGNYLTVEGTISDTDDSGSSWELGSNYYFTKATSAFVTFNKNDDYTFGAQHFFNKNVGLKAGYGNNWDDSGYDAYFANVSLQF